MTADQRDEKIEAISADNARLRDVERDLRSANAGLRKRLAEIDAVLDHRAQRIRELEAELRVERESARAIDEASCCEFRDLGDVVGIDVRGCYQLSSEDDCRVDCAAEYVISVARRQVAALEAQLRDSVPAAKVRALAEHFEADKRVHVREAAEFGACGRDFSHGLAIQCLLSAKELRALLPEVVADAPVTTEQVPETTPRRQCVVVPEVTFMDRVLNGGIAESELRTAFDAAVSEWHHADAEAKLHVWLGLAWREYATFLETGSLASVIEARRAKAPGTDANGAPVGGDR